MKKSKLNYNPENKPCEDAIMMRLILENIGDNVALKNICKVHGMELDELDKKQKNFLLKEEILIKTVDGYVWKNCV